MIYTIPKILENASSMHPNKEAFKYMSQSLRYEDLQNKAIEILPHK